MKIRKFISFDILKKLGACKRGRWCWRKAFGLKKVRISEKSLMEYLDAGRIRYGARARTRVRRAIDNNARFQRWGLGEGRPAGNIFC